MNLDCLYAFRFDSSLILKGVVRCTATYNDWYVTELNRGSNACPRVRCNRQNHETFVYDESKLKEAMQPPQHWQELPEIESPKQATRAAQARHWH